MQNIKKIVFNTIKKNKLRVTLLIFLVIALVTVSLLPPQILRIIIDDNLDVKKEEGLWALILLYLILLVSMGILDFLKGLVLTGFGQRVIHAVRSVMMQKTERIPLSYYSKTAAGTITSHFTTDVESINTLFADGVISMAIDLLKIIGIFISITLFSLKLGVITLLIIPLIAWISRTFQKKMRKAQNANLKQLSRVGNHIAESIHNSLMIKLFHKEDYMEDSFCDHLINNYRTKRKINFFDSIYAPIIQIIRAALIAVVVVLTSPQIGITGITIGMLAASIDLISSLLQPIESLGMEFQNIQQGFSGIKRVDDFLMLEEESKDQKTTAESILYNQKGTGAEISFHDVTFAYERGQNILEHVDFYVAPGEKVTLMGRTGVGKSTIMNLVLGLFLPQSGEVCINNFPTYLIPDREKRKIFGYVEQNFNFIPGSVKDQITLTDDRIPFEKVRDICTQVGLDESIMKMEAGYDTIITGSGEFSFGQRQLLSIARAIVMNPPILLLDEMTANLDSATEENIQKVLDKVCVGRTTLAISHRTSVIQTDGRIIMLQK